jgi:hypothetical protein
MLRAISVIDVNGCFGMSGTHTTKELNLEAMELVW